MASTRWILQVDEDLKNMEVLSTKRDHGNKGSIYKLPASLTDLNKKAYTPETVSFGPYHYDPSNPMEEHKHRALLHFLKRCGKSVRLFVEALAEVENELKDSYTQLHSVPKELTDIFLQLMILDGCFMLEIIRTGWTAVIDDYAPDDPIFANHGRLHVMPYIKRDMLMLENQLPMLVLDTLVAVETDEAKDEGSVTKLIAKFLSPGNVSLKKLGKCVHVLDVYRKCLLQHGPDRRYIRHKVRFMERDAEIIMWSATKLNEAGIKFKRSETRSLRDITFDRGVLRLPALVVDDTTESMLLNLMAFERFHVGAGTEVSSYVLFINDIMVNDRDFTFLSSEGIIYNYLGTENAVVNLFRSLSKDVTVDPHCSLEFVTARLRHFCRNPWNEWRADLNRTYFRNPWASFNLIVGVFLFLFTMAQTGYTIYAYYYPNGSSPSKVISVPTAPPPPPSHSSSDSTSQSPLLIFFIFVFMVCTLTN